MTEKDISVASEKIEDEKEYLQSISQQLWENPELKHEEIFAHKLLTEALKKYGFSVQEHYILPTAFRGEFHSGAEGGPTIAILCEYDALPDIGHACGHNLIAEAGIAAGMAVKTAMEADPLICGKIVVLGTPAEEGGFGKVRLIENGAFDDIDVALMVHPSRGRGLTSITLLCVSKVTVTYIGKETHASAFPWEGKNALDAAVACYINISLLRQQLKPTLRIHGIITKGGTAPNVIPGETEVQFLIRAPTVPELTSLKTRITACFESAALATGCESKINYSEDIYENLISNSILSNIFKEQAETLGMKLSGDDPVDKLATASTDMGNVSHVVPSIHPVYGIGGTYFNHTKEFTKQAASEEGQVETLAVSKAMAITVLKLLRDPKLVESAKIEFLKDLDKENAQIL